MSLIPKLRFTCLLNWVSHVSVETPFKPQFSGNPRSFATQRTRNEIRKMTQVAMFDYFYRTRGLQFLIAESMSKNAPVFNDNLLTKLNRVSDADGDLVKSITRFLRFHPVNEYEPFLESLGLMPSEFGHLIPSDKMFLNEDAFLLENYHIFWNYGIGREKMGKIFKEAKEVFGYEAGVLASKIQAYEDLGFSKLFLSKVIVCSPGLLIGNTNVDFAKVMAMLKSIRFGVDWVTENLSEEESYDWSSMHRVLSFLRDLCVDENELRELISKCPRLIFENSGEWTLILAGFETKLGSSRSELSSLFQKFPQTQGLEKCVSNLRHCFLFLKNIDMEANEIGKIFRLHSWWLGVSRLKQTRTLLNNLKGGKSGLRQVVQENPEEMKKWTVGPKIQPTEYNNLVPRDKLFLSDDVLLLENLHVLCDFGIDPKKIGKIFKEAREVFGYETGVFSYESLGFSRLFLLKLIVCSPRILIGDMNPELANVLEMLKSMGFGVDWVTENLSEEASYNWSSMHRVLSFLRDLCVDENELRELISKRPRLIFENSGEWALILAGFEIKLGSSRSELSSLFQKLPQIQGLRNCVSNLRHCFLFLKNIDMEANEIRKVFCWHSWWLGVSRLKPTKALLKSLKGGKSRLRQVIQENPEEMKKWTTGSKIQPLPATDVDTKAIEMKTQFLLYLGYKENSEEMERAFKSFSGRGSELRERFNVLVSFGLDEKVVKDMVKAEPNILRQECDMLESKVNCIVNELGYPLSTLVAFPSCLKYSLQRMKLRCEMFSWLHARGKGFPKLSLCTILRCTDKSFETTYVNCHPDGPKHFEDLKKKVLLCA